jgi:DNA-binding transcriptional regulator YdaS (Cro superfamily)
MANRSEPVGFTVQGIISMAGGCTAVAERLGVSPQAVSKWATKIPGVHARSVAIMAGLPLAIVRPDQVHEHPDTFIDESDEDNQA